MSAVLTLDQKELSRLAELESVVQRGQQTFIAVGNALAEIREARLYRETHGTFEDYCRDRWGWGRNYVSKLIGAASTVTALGTNVPAPTNEGQVRPLTKLKNDEDQYAAWVRANEIADEENKPVTGRIVERAVTEVSNVTPFKVYEPEPVAQTSKAYRYAQEAIVCLGKIRPNDPNRADALRSVIDWIKVNQ